MENFLSIVSDFLHGVLFTNPFFYIYIYSWLWLMHHELCFSWWSFPRSLLTGHSCLIGIMTFCMGHSQKQAGCSYWISRPLAGLLSNIWLMQFAYNSHVVWIDGCVLWLAVQMVYAQYRWLGGQVIQSRDINGHFIFKWRACTQENKEREEKKKGSFCHSIFRVCLHSFLFPLQMEVWLYARSYCFVTRAATVSFFSLIWIILIFKLQAKYLLFMHLLSLVTPLNSGKIYNDYCSFGSLWPMTSK